MLNNLAHPWRHRALIRILTWRDIKVRYKQAALGILWAVLQPVMIMVVFTVIFGRLAGLKPDAGIPEAWYPVFSLAALRPWQRPQASGFQPPAAQSRQPGMSCKGLP